MRFSFHDGDTFIYLIGTTNNPLRCRIINIDAPELHQPFGEESRDAMQKFAEQGESYVIIKGFDKFRRNLANIIVDGVQADEYAISNGLAYIYPKYNHNPKLVILQEEAKSKKLGIWAIQPQCKPYNYRKGIFILE